MLLARWEGTVACLAIRHGATVIRSPAGPDNSVAVMRTAWEGRYSAGRVHVEWMEEWMDRVCPSQAPLQASHMGRADTSGLIFPSSAGLVFGCEKTN